MSQYTVGPKRSGCRGGVNSRGGCRGRLAASQRSLVDIWHLPRALLRLGVVPVLSAALGRVLLPWLIRERTLDSMTQVSTTSLLPRTPSHSVPPGPTPPPFHNNKTNVPRQSS